MTGKLAQPRLIRRRKRSALRSVSRERFDADAFLEDALVDVEDDRRKQAEEKLLLLRDRDLFRFLLAPRSWDVGKIDAWHRAHARMPVLRRVLQADEERFEVARAA